MGFKVWLTLSLVVFGFSAQSAESNFNASTQALLKRTQNFNLLTRIGWIGDFPIDRVFREYFNASAALAQEFRNLEVQPGFTELPADTQVFFRVMGETLAAVGDFLAAYDSIMNERLPTVSAAEKIFELQLDTRVRILRIFERSLVPGMYRWENFFALAQIAFAIQEQRFDLPSHQLRRFKTRLGGWPALFEKLLTLEGLEPRAQHHLVSEVMNPNFAFFNNVFFREAKLSVIRCLKLRSVRIDPSVNAFRELLHYQDVLNHQETVMSAGETPDAGSILAARSTEEELIWRAVVDLEISPVISAFLRAEPKSALELHTWVEELAQPYGRRTLNSDEIARLRPQVASALKTRGAIVSEQLEKNYSHLLMAISSMIKGYSVPGTVEVIPGSKEYLLTGGARHLKITGQAGTVDFGQPRLIVEKLVYLYLANHINPSFTEFSLKMLWDLTRLLHGFVPMEEASHSFARLFYAALKHTRSHPQLLLIAEKVAAEPAYSAVARLAAVDYIIAKGPNPKSARIRRLSLLQNLPQVTVEPPGPYDRGPVWRWGETATSEHLSLAMRNVWAWQSGSHLDICESDLEN